MVWLCVICAALVITVCALLIKLSLMHKAADEIRTALDEKLTVDTNTLISISSGDRHLRRLCNDLNAQLRLLRQERRRLQSGDRRLKEAVANISHDLRTPLTAICGYLDLLKHVETSETAGRYIAIIERRTDALKQLTEGLFDYSVAAAAPDEYETVVLNHALTESLSAYYAVLKQRNITPQVSIPEQNVTRRLDRNALSRILENVIHNAVKYSDGDLAVTLTGAGEIRFANRAARLDEIEVGRLFDRFYTVETGKKSTGLGLSIAKTLTEQMGGAITAAYQNGRVIICIRFPQEH